MKGSLNSFDEHNEGFLGGVGGGGGGVARGWGVGGGGGGGILAERGTILLRFF